MRQRAVEAVPAGSSLEFKSPQTLSAWQARGTYTLSSASSTRLAIVVAPTDFGGALFSDAAFHLDHALEHQASLMNALATGQWSSPAWQVVTFYYWSYYCAMALSRLLGRTVWFVTPNVAQQFTTLAARGGHRVSRGTYELSCGAYLSAGAREIALAKRPRRLHEQLWATVFDLLGSVYQEVGVGVATPQEERLYLAIISSARILGNDWPSSIRNIVNYRPGFAYTAPRFKSCIDSFTYLSTQAQTIDGLVDRLENNNILMRNDPRIDSHPKIVARMLVDLTLLLSRITSALHDELVDRSGLDRRWLVSKRRFAQQRGILSAGVPWPC